MSASIIQRSPEWRQARLGKVTASRVADVIARTKSGWGAARANYMAQLIAERLSGDAQDGYSNAAMAWGVETEAEARRAYAFEMDVDVTTIGFAPHPSLAMSGASPDGLIGLEGLVEIKCPNTSTHLDTLLAQSPPEKYLAQMQWQMACTGRRWCDFVSYDPRLPEDLRLFVHRTPRDEAQIAALHDAIESFLGELEAKIAAVTALCGRRRAA